MDLSPLFRSTIGFDRMSRLLDAALQVEEPAYPPYDIERRGQDSYRITMAVAGFTEDDLEMTESEGMLIVRGRGRPEAQESQTTYLHRGIAGRAFERRFQLADYVHVTGASLENGLLHIDLVREVPEALKPRTIHIETGTAPQQIEQQAA
jgi:molecular chaperone IbpA